MMNKPDPETNGPSGTRLSFDSHDNTELANALLSLGTKYTLPNVLESTFKDDNPYRKPEYVPLAVAAPPTFASLPAVSLPPQTNPWMGGSGAALIGYPYTSYGIDPGAFCGCASRVANSFPTWKPYQQAAVSEFSTTGSTLHQPSGLCYPQPLHHPLGFVSNGLQSNIQGYNSIESRNNLAVSVYPHHQAPPQQPDQQVPAGLPQQLFGDQSMKINDELPSPPHCLKQAPRVHSPVAVVAPLILEFNQKKQVQGIPLIYNMNQWLNVPSCENDPLVNADNKPRNTLPIYHGQNCNSQIASAPMQSWITAEQRRDPICQLGEAANMILQCQEAKATIHHASSQMVNTPTSHIQSCVSSVAIGNHLKRTVEEEGTHLQKGAISSLPTDRANAPKNLKNRTCPYCHKVFARPFTLKSHIRRHTKEKPYTCKLCQRSFSQSATLENHKLTHTGAKPHQCNLCLKRFAHQTSLKTHLRIHSGEQPYECEYCSRRFTDGSTLQKHKRTHSGDKPFPCRFCFKRFSQSGNMRRHMAATHKESLNEEPRKFPGERKSEGSSNCQVLQ